MRRGSVAATRRAWGMAMTKWTFEIPGQPVPWERVTQGKHGAVRTARTRRHEQAVHALATIAGVRAGLGPVRVTIDAFFSDRHRRDLDNVAKAILDGLTGAPVLDGDHWECVRELVVRGALDAANPRTVVNVEVIRES